MLFIWIFFLLFNSIILQAQVIDDTSKPDEIIVKSTRSNSNVYQLGSSVEIYFLSFQVFVLVHLIL